MIVCAPLLTAQGAIGVLYLDSRRPETLSTSQDRAVLEAFSSHAAVALENARLHRELLDAQAGLERENRDLRRAQSRASWQKRSHATPTLTLWISIALATRLLNCHRSTVPSRGQHTSMPYSRPARQVYTASTNGNPVFSASCGEYER